MDHHRGPAACCVAAGRPGVRRDGGTGGPGRLRGPCRPADQQAPPGRPAPPRPPPCAPRRGRVRLPARRRPQWRSLVRGSTPVAVDRPGGPGRLGTGRRERATGDVPGDGPSNRRRAAQGSPGTAGTRRLAQGPPARARDTAGSHSAAPEGSRASSRGPAAVPTGGRTTRGPGKPGAWQTRGPTTRGPCELEALRTGGPTNPTGSAPWTQGAPGRRRHPTAGAREAERDTGPAGVPRRSPAVGAGGTVTPREECTRALPRGAGEGPRGQPVCQLDCAFCPT